MLYSLALYNPLRYRGYVYDRETGLYYVSSRYYNPEICRWINADSVLPSAGSSPIGYNMFAYCFNNPVNMTDPSGNWPKWLKNSIKWVASNVVKPAVKYVQEKLSESDFTYSIGINGSATPSAFIFNVQGGISVDSKGNFALQGSAGGGLTGGTPGASISVYQSISNAPSIYHLEGPSYQIGGSISAGVSVSGDYVIIPDTTLNTTYSGFTGNGGIGTTGGEFHVEWGETRTWNGTQFNIFDYAATVYHRIMEW